jgi:hypothetical protein
MMSIQMWSSVRDSCCVVDNSDIKIYNFIIECLGDFKALFEKASIPVSVVKGGGGGRKSCETVPLTVSDYPVK